MLGGNGDGDGDAAGGDQAAPQGRGNRRASDDPMTPEDVGKEFGPFLSFGMTKPTGLDTYGSDPGRAAGRRRRVGRARPARVPDHGEDAAGEAAEPDPSSYNENGWEAGLLEKIDAAAAGSGRSRSAARPATRRTASGATASWSSTISCSTAKYPFTRSKGVRDAHVDDVQKFFQPKTGTLWQYFSESLQSEIDHPAGTTLFHVRDGSSAVKYKPGLTVFLKRAQEITDLLFAKLSRRRWD
ncbi:MAG: hypothetical protein QM796_13290 [Chthoniobacteraceae bacterium]